MFLANASPNVIVRVNKLGVLMSTPKDVPKLQPLADLEGGVRRARPPKGPDSFVLTYKFFEM